MLLTRAMRSSSLAWRRLEKRLSDRLSARCSQSGTSTRETGVGEPRVALSGLQRRLAAKVLGDALEDPESVQAWGDLVNAVQGLEGRQLLEVLRTEGLATPRSRDRQAAVLQLLKARLEIDG